MPTTNRDHLLPGDQALPILPGLPVIALSVDNNTLATAQKFVEQLCSSVPQCSLILMMESLETGWKMAGSGYHQQVLEKDQLLVPNSIILVPPGNMVAVSNGTLRLIASQEKLPFTLVTDQLFYSLLADKQTRAIAIQFTDGLPASGALLAVAMAGGFSMTRENNYRYSLNENTFAEEGTLTGATRAVQQFIAFRFNGILTRSLTAHSGTNYTPPETINNLCHNANGKRYDDKKFAGTNHSSAVATAAGEACESLLVTDTDNLKTAAAATGSFQHTHQQEEKASPARSLLLHLANMQEEWLIVWIYDISTLQILDVNQHALNNYGYSRQEFVGLPLHGILGEKDLEQLAALHQQEKTTDHIISIGTLRHSKKNGEIILVEMSGQRIWFNERECMIVAGKDITHQQATEEALRFSNERYAYVTRASFDAIWDWDLVKDTIYWGEGFETLFGYSTTIHSNNAISWKSNIHPEDAPRVLKGVTRFIEGNGINWNDEYRFLKTNGEYAIVADRGLVVRDENGKAVRMIGTMQDITRKKEEEQRLRLFESVVTNINDGVLITGHLSIDGDAPAVVYVNDAFTSMTGYNSEELVGQTINILLGKNTSVRTLARLNKCIHNNVPCEFEIISYKKNGEECWISFSIVPVRNNEQVVVYWIAIARDITHRKKQDAEKELFFSLLQALGKQELSFAWKNILETLGEYAGFQYGEAWQVNFDQSDLLLNGRWKNDSLKEMETGGYIKKIRKGEGITGNAWQQHCVTFVNDITNNTVNLERQFAINYGLNSAAFIPVLFNGQTISMLSFYSTCEAIDPINFKSLFDTISQQLGPYVQSKKAEAELARFFDLSPDFLAIAGTDGYFKKINPAFSKILGYTKEELFAKPIAFFTHPDDREVTQHKREGLKEGMPLTNFENRYVTKTGEARWFSWTSTPLAEEGLIFAVAKDTTEKKKLDEDRKRLLESISDYFFALDTKLNFTYLNSVTATLLGDARNSLVGKNLWEAWPHLKEGIFLQAMQQSIKSREPVAFEFYDETRDNWFEGSFYPSEDGLSVFFRSFNDRKLAEQALQEAFKEKDTILESIGDAFFAVDKHWTVTYWNKMAEQMLNTTRDHIVGKNLWEIFKKAAQLPFYSQYRQAMETNEAVHFEEYYPPLKIWLDISAYPSRDGLSVYFKDISVRKEAAEAIRTSNERYDLVAKATNDNIWDWDLVSNQVTRPGKRLETIYGYPPQEDGEVDAFWRTHVHPEDWISMTEKRNALLADPAENFWEDEYRFLTTSGDYGFVYDKGYIIRDLQGKAIRIIGASQDITKEKRQVNEIIRIKQNLDSLINTTSDLIWSIDTELQIIAANAAYLEVIYCLTGHPIKEGDQVVYPSSNKEMQANCALLYQRALSGESFHIEDSFNLPGTNGIQHTIISFSPIINKEGNISGVACFAKDITDLKTAGAKLLELNNSLEKRAAELAISNGELERFAYVASHDLQEPLRMVSSFMQLLQRKYNDQLDETARKYIHFSVDGAERMKQLINDLLQYSRVGTSSLEITKVDMNEVMQDVLLLFKNEVHTIDAEIIIDTLPVIDAGKSAMAQLMQNLVGNALKYRSIEKPFVSISATEQPDAWEFVVKDNGIGIDEQYREKIFIIFQRLHNKDQFNGTGIGLAICKKIIERYQGKIWVESEFGKGSKFIFAIPKRN